MPTWLALDVGPICTWLVSWKYTIDKALGAVFTEAAGILTEVELVAGVRALYEDPQFHPDFRGLFDYTRVTTNEISSERMASMAAMRKYSANARTAFLVTGQLSYGLGRVYQSWIDEGQVMVTYNRAEALAWLNEGVPPEKVLT